VTTAALHAALVGRFAPPEWALFFEVGNATGFGRNRAADAIAMSLWPSRGLQLHGFELKASRSDWLREKKDPAKAEAIARFCERWWLVVTDEKILLPGELPATWGLLALRKGKLHQIVEAPTRESEPLARGFIAALLRSATESVVPRSAVDELVAKTVEERITSRKGCDEAALQRALERERELRQIISTFEAASGVNISHWPGPQKVGDAVRFILDGGIKANRAALERLRRQAKEIVDAVDGTLAAGEALQPGAGERAS
jgi:hypothetical protein